MSNREANPREMVCTAERSERDPADGRAGRVSILTAREVPLGGPRAMTVRRTLPQRERSFVGAWCFVDHYGPDDVSATGGMDVPPHPHTGLQTVSWLFEGEIEHRDSHGVHGMVRPGEVNLMTAGAGICHSEVSTPQTSTLHGVQLWVVLPKTDRGTGRRFENFAAPLVEVASGVRARVFVGSLAGQESPVWTATQLIGAEIHLEAGASWELPVDPAHEHGLLVDRGAVRFEGVGVPVAELGVVEAGPDRLRIEAETPARVLLLGGTPFEEEIVMWWNFIGSDHDEIARFRQEWEEHADRFGAVEGYEGATDRLPAPGLPGSRLRPRGREGRGADAR